MPAKRVVFMVTLVGKCAQMKGSVGGKIKFIGCPLLSAPLIPTGKLMDKKIDIARSLLYLHSFYIRNIKNALPHAVTRRWALPFLFCSFNFKSGSLDHFFSLSLLL